MTIQTKFIKIGFLQALAILVYTSLIGFFLSSLGNLFGSAEPGFLGIGFFLTLLVFSAGITGSLVFGYAAYLMTQKRFLEACLVLGYTLGFCLLGLCIFLGVIAF